MCSGFLSQQEKLHLPKQRNGNGEVPATTCKSSALYSMQPKWTLFKDEKWNSNGTQMSSTGILVILEGSLLKPDLSGIKNASFLKFSRLVWYNKVLENDLICSIILLFTKIHKARLIFWPLAQFFPEHCVEGVFLCSQAAQCLCFHFRRLKMLFLLEVLSTLLRPMRSRAFSSSSCCCRLLSDFPSETFPRTSEPGAGFRRSFSLIIWTTSSRQLLFFVFWFSP